jgi:hypothetical protein
MAQMAEQVHVCASYWATQMAQQLPVFEAVNNELRLVPMSACTRLEQRPVGRYRQQRHVG